MSLIVSLYSQPPHILVVDDLPKNRKLASEVLSRQGYRVTLAGDGVEALHKGAMLHDIGTLGISDTILRKEGSLDAEEWKQMRQHPVIGVELVSSLKSLGDAMKVIRSHHVRWDG